MRTIKQLMLFALPALLLAGCSNEEFTDDPGTQPGTNGGDIEFAIGFAPTTRAATAADFTSAWEDGDEIGVFAVAHGSTLATSGNHIHNVKLTYNKTAGTWSGGAYWPENSSSITKLDFYAYHPYDDNGGSPQALDPTAIAFNVSTNQSGMTDIGGGTMRPNYNLSDLLTAKSDNSNTGWSKSDGAVSLIFSHALAMVQVTVDDSKYMALDINGETIVKLRGVKAGAMLNLGGVSGPKVELATTNNDPGDITMHRVADAGGYIYRALVPAQTLAQDASIFRIMSGNVLLNGSALTGNKTMIAGSAETFTQKTPYTALPLIAKGTFQMGSPPAEPNRQSNETQHWVKLTGDFYISRYQITNAQYAAFLNDEGIGEDGKWTLGSYSTQILIKSSATEWGGSYNWGLNWDGSKWIPVAGYENHPVIYVTWYGAMSYCQWLTQTTGTTCTLPTEAQWEYACRGDYPNKAAETNTMPFGIGDGRKLVGGMANYYVQYSYDISENGEYQDASGHSTYYKGKTIPVGDYPYPNGYGLYDMHGNVFEWCLDQCDWPIPDYGSGSATDPVGTAGSSRVLRGGSWNDDAQLCRSAYRGSANPDYAGNFIGFRVVFVPQFTP